jgi:uncharacterized OB-fold protein
VEVAPADVASVEVGMEEYGKPLPEVTPDNKPFWDACKRGELSLPGCLDCGHLRLPGPICPQCLSMKAEWTVLSGRGRLYTWTTIHQRYHAGFAGETPYNVAMIELEEGPRLIANIVNCGNDDLTIGMEVEVVFDDVTGDVTLPRFCPASPGPASPGPARPGAATPAPGSP